MIELKATNLHWLVGDGADEKGDLCAHSPVHLKIGDRVVSDEKSGDWAVSAASYYLLKALSDGHDGTKEPQLLPCCGMPMPIGMTDDDPVLVGCPNGINWSITTEDRRMVHSFNNEFSVETDRDEWRNAVCRFSLEIRQFFKDSSPKQTSDLYEERGFELFLRDWDLLIKTHCR